MRSIKRKFGIIKRSNPYWSDIICYVNTVSGQNYHPKNVHKWFRLLVDKDDYRGTSIFELLKYLEEINKSG